MQNKSSRKGSNRGQVQGILGVGLHGPDGQKRVTGTEGDSARRQYPGEVEEIQGTAIRFAEGLEKLGKVLPVASVREAIDQFRKTREKVRRLS